MRYMDARDWGGTWSTLIQQNDGGSQIHFPNAYSDARLKENIRNSDVDALGSITRIPVRAFRWNDDGAAIQSISEAHREVRIGVVAQEVQPLVPEAVKGGLTSLPSVEGPFERYALKSDEFIPYLIRAIQQQQEQITALQSRVAALEVVGGVRTEGVAP